MTSEAKLPESFLRGLEADLRALCTDARRKNPQVKDAAERVILALKEADTQELKIAAADSAAAAFCSACEAPPSSSSGSLSSYVKVVLRAVSSLHKLLTHRAVSSERLPEVLDALHRLAMSCVDDTITLKVLQGLLSLLTVRAYSKALTEDELSRAFSLLFVLKTSRAPNMGNPAANALSAISSAAGGGTGAGGTMNNSSPDLGVIEQTSKAAFRQASSDLFASAADAAVQTAVRMQVPSGEVIPLEDFPTEARASYRFFMDLCHAVSGEPMSWLSRLHQHQQQPLSLDLALALEVIDDGLSSSVGLFAAQPVFLDILSKTLCPVIHNLLSSKLDRSSTKALFALIVTVVTHYWRNLPVESQDLLHALVNNIKQGSTSNGSITWPAVFAMEALRCIFRSQLADSNAAIDFVREFELSEWSTNPISAIVNISSGTATSLTSLGTTKSEFPSPPVTGSLKPFAKTITNSSTFLAAVSIGVYIQIIKVAELAVQRKAFDTANVLLNNETTEKAVVLIGKLIELNPFSHVPATPRLADATIPDPISVLAQALSGVTIVAYSCELDMIRTLSFSTLCSVCSTTARSIDESNNPSVIDFAKRVGILYDVLFEVVSKCQELLGRSWISAIESFEVLDSLVYKVDQAGEKNPPVLKATINSLKPRLNAVFVATEYLRWSACHDMISALVQCSRQSMATLSRRTNASEEMQSKGELPGANLRVFGITTAEIAILTAFRRKIDSADTMPSKLWELLAGHLTSVCSDSSIYALRQFALNSLTRIACEAVPSTDATVITHEKILTPFLDLFNSAHPDVRSGSLSSLYTILETQGERLKGEHAWRVVLSILTTAAGSKAYAKVKDGGPMSLSNATQRSTTTTSTSSTASGGLEMISEGFKVVQVIADDFLSSLARNSLPAWLEVLGLYCRQEDNINVALTSIGLLWRTADFLAKETDEAAMEDWLWVEVFQILKEVSMDERPEIRNCAVKTLTGALTAHSMKLSARAWSGCTERALLPLLEEVMKGGSVLSSNNSNLTANGAVDSNGGDNDGPSTVNANSNQDSSLSSVAPTAGTATTSNVITGSASANRNDSVVMWHHSRDTPRKQWNETRVLALGGVAKVLRSAMPRLAMLRDENGRPLFLTLTVGGANGLWRKMLRAAGVAAASRDGEVAVAGVSALLEMLSAAGFVVGEHDVQQKVNHNDKHQSTPPTNNDLAPSASAPASLGSDTTSSASASVAASMSWVAGVITGSTSSNLETTNTNNHQEDELSNSTNNTSQEDRKQKSLESQSISADVNITVDGDQEIKGTIMLWEAVWSALVEAICGVDTAIVLDNYRPDEKDEISQDGMGGDRGEGSHLNQSVSTVTASTASNPNEGSKIVDEKALQMLAEGLIESRSKLADKFTPRSSRMLLQVLMYLAGGQSADISATEQEHQHHQKGTRALSEVQEVTLNGLKELSFGSDVQSWTGLLQGLLQVIQNARHSKHRHRHKHLHHYQHEHVVLIRRALDIVRSLYVENSMPNHVKISQLQHVIPIFGRIMLARKDLDRISSRITSTSSSFSLTTNPTDRSSRSSTNSATSAAAVSKDKDVNELTLWKTGCDTLLDAMRRVCDIVNHEQQQQEHISSETKMIDLTNEWNTCAQVFDQFLFNSTHHNANNVSSPSKFIPSSPPSRLDSTIQNMMHMGASANTNSKLTALIKERYSREQYDMKVVSCVVAGIEQTRVFTNTSSASYKRKLISILVRGASEGELFMRRKFVRLCQACLFSLASSSTSIKSPSPSVVEECGRSVVNTCAHVLAKYIADGARAGRCPLPAVRRSEAVFLLRQLRKMAVNNDRKDGVDGQDHDQGKKWVLALYPSLCECVESGDEAVKLLARELLEETSSKMQNDPKHVTATAVSSSGSANLHFSPVGGVLTGY